MMNTERAIEILSQASQGILTLNDDFKEACGVAARVLSRELALSKKSDYKWKSDKNAK